MESSISEAAAFDGAWREIPVLTLEGVPFSSTSVLEFSRTGPKLGNTRLVTYLGALTREQRPRVSDVLTSGEGLT